MINRLIETKTMNPVATHILSGQTVDDLIQELEIRGLGWSLDHTAGLIEARIWEWPNVIGRYRPSEVEPLHIMIGKAMMDVDWTKYPPKSPKTKPKP